MNVISSSSAVLPNQLNGQKNSLKSFKMAFSLKIALLVAVIEVVISVISTLPSPVPDRLHGMWQAYDQMALWYYLPLEVIPLLKSKIIFLTISQKPFESNWFSSVHICIWTYKINDSNSFRTQRSIDIYKINVN